MSAAPIDTTPLERAIAMLREAIELWRDAPTSSRLKPHLRSAVVQSFEFSYELAIRSLRRALIERAEAADLVADLSFNDLLRRAADAGLLDEPIRWREWREMRNATSHAYDEAKAQALAERAAAFCDDAAAVLVAIRSGGS
jgi:nucleotidyltransferase substrate binding protein (TIGR01987 family)